MKGIRTKSVADYNNQFYTERYNDTSYVAMRIADAKRLMDRIQRIVSFKKGSNVLDLGCGTGEAGNVVKERFNAIVYGVDMNSTAIKKAKENGLRAYIANVEKTWPFENNFFDGVICTQMIEHLVNPDFFLLESKRVLKNNGLLVITTPNLAVWFNRILFLFGFQPFFTEVSTFDKTLGLSFTRKLTPIRKPLGHLRCFTLKALREIVELHGFEIVAIQGSAVNYLPKYIAPLDKFFSLFPGLASDLVIVARKK